MNKATRRQAIKATAAAIGITGVGIGVNAPKQNAVAQESLSTPAEGSLSGKVALVTGAARGHRH